MSFIKYDLQINELQLCFTMFEFTTLPVKVRISILMSFIINLNYTVAFYEIL